MSSSVALVDALVQQVQQVPTGAAKGAAKGLVPTETKDKKWWPIIPPGHTPYTWYGVVEGEAAAAPAEPVKAPAAAAAAPAAAASASAAPTPSGEGKPEKKAKQAKPAKAAAAAAAPAAPEVQQPEYSKLDIRVGQIVKASRHPKPDVLSLYVEEIDVGEEQPRTIVSGLVKYISLEDFSKARVCVICNLKPSALQGVTSQGMVLAASTGEGDARVVELIVPPAGAKPGDRILPLSGEDLAAFEPLAVVDPKAKKNNVWAAVAAQLKTNEQGEATWEGKVLGTKEHGAAKAASLKGANIA